MLDLLRRGWFRPWEWSSRTWLIFVAVGFLLSPLMVRWVCLSRVPDVSLPFNLEDVIRDEASLEKDAFPTYSNAFRLYQWRSASWADYAIQDALNDRHFKWDERLDDWLISLQDALAEFRRGSEIKQGHGPSLKTADCMVLLPVQQACRSLARVAAVEALRCSRAGDWQTASILQRANLRCSIHAEQPGLMICRLIGISIRAMTCDRIARWADDPSVTPEGLRAVRQEIATVAAKRIPLTDVGKAEYLSNSNTWRHADAAQQWLYQEVPVALQYAALWVIGQPELYLRLERQLLLNIGDELDKPLFQRRANISTKGWLVFDVKSDQRRRGQLDSQSLEELSRERTINLGVNGWSFLGSQVDVANRLDDPRLASVDIILAAHEYHRQRGEFPEKLDQLVLDFLDAVPFDPMDVTGAPLRYRREENGEAIIWSIGRDAKDDGGDVDGNHPKDIGYRIRLKPKTEVKIESQNGQETDQ